MGYPKQIRSVHFNHFTSEISVEEHFFNESIVKGCLPHTQLKEMSVLVLSHLGSSWPLKDGKIVGGKDTEIDKVPYTVSLEYAYNHYCGGTIISPTFILTAAHCIMNQDVKFGSIRTGSSTLLKGGTNYKVKRFIPNPKYDRKTIDYDIGLVELAEPIKFDKNSQPAKLPSMEPKGGEMVTVSGWGFLNEGGERPKMLQSVVMPAKTRQECETIFEKYTFTPRMICIGASGKDACQGDSGGPAVHNNNIVGVVSWGIGCGREGYAGVYANVANPDIRKFIREHTGL